MSCTTIIQGFEIDCLGSNAGVAEIYVTEFANVPQANITESSGVITAMSCSSGKKFWTIQCKKQTAQADEKVVPSQENGTLYYEQSVALALHKLSASLRYTVKSLAVNRLMIIVKDNNEIIKLFGQTRGCDIGESTASTGKAYGDFNGVNLSFVGMEAQPASTMSQAILTTLLS